MSKCTIRKVVNGGHPGQIIHSVEKSFSVRRDERESFDLCKVFVKQVKFRKWLECFGFALKRKLWCSPKLNQRNDGLSCSDPSVVPRSQQQWWFCDMLAMREIFMPPQFYHQCLKANAVIYYQEVSERFLNTPGYKVYAMKEYILSNKTLHHLTRLKEPKHRCMTVSMIMFSQKHDLSAHQIWTYWTMRDYGRVPQVRSPRNETIRINLLVISVGKMMRSSHQSHIAMIYKISTINATSYFSIFPLFLQI